MRNCPTCGSLMHPRGIYGSRTCAGCGHVEGAVDFRQIRRQLFAELFLLRQRLAQLEGAERQGRASAEVLRESKHLLVGVTGLLTRCKELPPSELAG